MPAAASARGPPGGTTCLWLAESTSAAVARLVAGPRALARCIRRWLPRSPHGQLASCHSSHWQVRAKRSSSLRCSTCLGWSHGSARSRLFVLRVNQSVLRVSWPRHPGPCRTRNPSRRDHPSDPSPACAGATVSDCLSVSEQLQVTCQWSTVRKCPSESAACVHPATGGPATGRPGRRAA